MGDTDVTHLLPSFIAIIIIIIIIIIIVIIIIYFFWLEGRSWWRQRSPPMLYPITYVRRYVGFMARYSFNIR